MAAGAIRLEGLGERSSSAFVVHNQALFAAQLKARRGPTPEVHFLKHLDNSRLVKQADPKRAKEMRVFTAAVTVLFTLVMIYGFQHLQSIMIGYHLEEAKQHMEALREENRQLQLTEAKLRDPGRLAQVAHDLGLQAPVPGQVVRPDQPAAAGDAVLAMVDQPKQTVR